MAWEQYTFIKHFYRRNALLPYKNYLLCSLEAREEQLPMQLKLVSAVFRFDIRTVTWVVFVPSGHQRQVSQPSNKMLLGWRERWLADTAPAAEGTQRYTFRRYLLSHLEREKRNVHQLEKFFFCWFGLLTILWTMYDSLKINLGDTLVCLLNRFQMLQYLFGDLERYYGLVQFFRP